MTRYGPAHWSLAETAPQAWKSLYYHLPRASAAWFGPSEIAFRLPSILLMGLTLFLVARLAARLIHPQAAWFAVFACLTLRGINYEAADARPYRAGNVHRAPAACCSWCDGSIRCAGATVCCLSSSRRCCGASTCCSGRSTWCSRAYAIARREAPTPYRRSLRAGGSVAGARALRRPRPPSRCERARLRRASRPARLRLLAEADAGSRMRRGRLAAGPVATLASLGRAVGRPAPRLSFSAGGSVHPVALFLVSRADGFQRLRAPLSSPSRSPARRWPPRLCRARWIPPDRWKPLGLASGAGALLWLGQWHQLWPLHHNSDWRAAARAVNEFAGRIRPGPLPQPVRGGPPPLWRPDYPLPGFLYSHLAVYPIAGQPVLLPYRDYPAAADLLPQSHARRPLPACTDGSRRRTSGATGWRRGRNWRLEYAPAGPVCRRRRGAFRAAVK